jgi:hypothetical protein
MAFLMRLWFRISTVQIWGEDRTYHAVHLVGQTFQTAIKSVVGQHGWNRYGQPNRRGEQRLPDAARKYRWIGLAAGQFQLPEGLNHAEHGTEQPQQRCQSADDFQRAQITAQLFQHIVAASGQLLANPGFIEIGAPPIVNRQLQEPGGRVARAFGDLQRLA